MKRVFVRFLLIGLIIFCFCSCNREAKIASHNISYKADRFQVLRRIVFFNGITDKYLLVIEGFCSINYDAADRQLEVTCKVGPTQYRKHFFGLSDNAAYFVEQLADSNVSPNHYKVLFKPTTFLPSPDVDLTR